MKVRTPSSRKKSRPLSAGRSAMVVSSEASFLDGISAMIYEGCVHRQWFDPYLLTTRSKGFVVVKDQKPYPFSHRQIKSGNSMSELSVQKVELKKNWKLTQRSFDQLLNWLDEGRNSDGQKYLEMRERLVAYFDRKNCIDPDDLADQ